jgi:hypothetical protein
MQRILLAVLAATVGLAGSVQAQHTRQPVMSSRVVLNGHSMAALGTSVGGDFGSIDTHSGLGAGVEVGYRITPRLLAYAGLDIAKQGINEVGLDGDFGLTHIEAGARLSFPITGSKMMPYVGGWVGPPQPHHDGGGLRDRDPFGALAVRPWCRGHGRSAVLRVAESRAGRRSQPRLREDGEREGGRTQGGLGDAGQHHHDPDQVRGELVSLTTGH